MKKIVCFILVGMLLCKVQAKSQEPRYQIIAATNQKEDIKEIYHIKKELLEDYKVWVKGVDNKHQVLADHIEEYDALYDQGVYKIVVGKGKGKSIEGELKVNYCENTKDIQTKSFFFSWLF